MKDPLHFGSLFVQRYMLVLMGETYGSYPKKSLRSYGGLHMSLVDQDFHEDEVWDAYKDHTENCSPPKCENFPAAQPQKSKTQSRTAQSNLSRMIGRANNVTYPAKAFQHSLPVSIPDWSKIYGQSSSPKSYKRASVHREDDYANENNDADELYDLPPHEWLDRRLSRTQMSSFSVVEGFGRTLKGRDLSKVRDSVLTRTGFLE